MSTNIGGVPKLHPRYGYEKRRSIAALWHARIQAHVSRILLQGTVHSLQLPTTRLSLLIQLTVMIIET